MIFCDLDGTLADFDAGYKKLTGVRADKKEDNVDWSAVAAAPMFYATLPKMADCDRLWSFLLPLHPVILTGLPRSIPGAGKQKDAWVATHLGIFVPVILCPSKDKSLYCQPGDLLIDDWEKYQSLWLAKGGRWITYHNAEQVIREMGEQK